MKATIVVLTLLTLAACSDQRLSLMRDEAAETASPEAVVVRQNYMEKSEAKMPDTPARMLIKNGSLGFMTTDLNKTKSGIAAICKSMGAYSSEETMSNDEYRVSFHQVIRVPENRFEELVHKIEQLADTLEERSIESRDVTEEFIDVEARVKTKREVEKRYLELFKQAKTVDNMLDIEREIGNVRSEIESMEGRLRYLRNRISLSTLTVEYYQVTEAEPGLASQFLASFVSGWENLVLFLINVSAAWPFLLFLAGGSWWLLRFIRKRIAQPA
jgi:hypothetical protein